MNNAKNLLNKFVLILLKFICFALSIFLFALLFTCLASTQDLGWFINIEQFPFLFFILYSALKLADWAGIPLLPYIYKKTINYLWMCFIVMAVFYALLACYQHHYGSDVFKNSWRVLDSMLYVPFFVIVAIYNFKLKKAFLNSTPDNKRK